MSEQASKGVTKNGWVLLNSDEPGVYVPDVSQAEKLVKIWSQNVVDIEEIVYKLAGQARPKP